MKLNAFYLFLNPLKENVNKIKHNACVQFKGSAALSKQKEKEKI